jgi:hypothetical protein
LCDDAQYAMSVNLISLINHQKILDIVKESTVVKGFKLSLYVLKFIGLHNYNRVLCNRNILKLRFDPSKEEPH